MDPQNFTKPLLHSMESLVETFLDKAYLDQVDKIGVLLSRGETSKTCRFCYEEHRGVHMVAKRLTIIFG